MPGTAFRLSTATDIVIVAATRAPEASTRAGTASPRGPHAPARPGPRRPTGAGGVSTATGGANSLKARPRAPQSPQRGPTGLTGPTAAAAYFCTLSGRGASAGRVSFGLGTATRKAFSFAVGEARAAAPTTAAPLAPRVP